MQAIKDGMLYDSMEARQIWRCFEGRLLNGNYYAETLFVTQNNRFFLVVKTRDRKQELIPLTTDETFKWMQNKSTPSHIILRFFSDRIKPA